MKSAIVFLPLLFPPLPATPVDQPPCFFQPDEPPAPSNEPPHKRVRNMTKGIA